MTHLILTARLGVDYRRRLREETITPLRLSVVFDRRTLQIVRSGSADPPDGAMFGSRFRGDAGQPVLERRDSSANVHRLADCRVRSGGAEVRRGRVGGVRGAVNSVDLPRPLPHEPPPVVARRALTLGVGAGYGERGGLAWLARSLCRRQEVTRAGRRVGLRQADRGSSGAEVFI
jgi:hypothetical protein